MPIDAQNAKILKLSVGMIAYFSAFVRKKCIPPQQFTNPSGFIREAQGKPFLNLILHEEAKYLTQENTTL